MHFCRNTIFAGAELRALQDIFNSSYGTIYCIPIPRLFGKKIIVVEPIACVFFMELRCFCWFCCLFCFCCLCCCCVFHRHLGVLFSLVCCSFVLSSITRASLYSLWGLFLDSFFFLNQHLAHGATTLRFPQTGGRFLRSPSFLSFFFLNYFQSFGRVRRTDTNKYTTDRPSGNKHSSSSLCRGAHLLFCTCAPSFASVQPSSEHIIFLFLEGSQPSGQS